MTDVKDAPRVPAKRADKAPIPASWDYAPAPEAKDLVKIEDHYGLFIGGKFVEPISKQRYTTIDPSREEPLSEIAQAGKAGHYRRTTVDERPSTKHPRVMHASAAGRPRTSDRAPSPTGSRAASTF